MSEPPLRVVLCTAPAGAADTLARSLVEARLAACVNAVPGVVSHYVWEGKLTRDEEVLLVIKTRAERLPALTAAIRAAHPYAVPEVIGLAVEPAEGNPDYRAWVLDATREA